MMTASELLLEGLRERNTLLDSLFYDVDSLSRKETAMLTGGSLREGALIEVAPGRETPLLAWRDYAEFAGHQRDYAALAVAGAGSSALGAAAFARNVAEAAGAPVLAVVSGYGVADLITESLGGWLLFAGLNQVRHSFEWIDDWRRLATSRGTLLGLEGFDPVALARRSKDVRTLMALLADGRRFDWLVGHSKGNLVLSEAIYALRETAPPAFDALTQVSRIITVSAKIMMPRGFAQVIDVMGELDGLGALNSRPAIATDILVPRAGHHTNTALPFCLPIAPTLRPLMAG